MSQTQTQSQSINSNIIVSASVAKLQPDASSPNRNILFNYRNTEYDPKAPRGDPRSRVNRCTQRIAIDLPNTYTYDETIHVLPTTSGKKYINANELLKTSDRKAVNDVIERLLQSIDHEPSYTSLSRIYVTNSTSYTFKQLLCYANMAPDNTVSFFFQLA